MLEFPLGTAKVKEIEGEGGNFASDIGSPQQAGQVADQPSAMGYHNPLPLYRR